MTSHCPPIKEDLADNHTIATLIANATISVVTPMASPRVQFGGHDNTHTACRL